ncbi:divalent-cation tolerance protein CutA [Verrucomicrobiota bacterium]
MSAKLVYVTCVDEAEAEKVAAAVVEEKLAACANMLPGMKSIYWWDGAVQSSTECVLILKTDARLAAELSGRICELHSYECPCVAVMPIESGNPDYLEWIRASVRPQ